MRLLVIGLMVSVSWSASAQTGPGGVGNSATNQLWLMANNGVFTDAGITLAANGNNVQQWNDLSGNAKNAIQLTAANQPNYQTVVMNGFPVIRFTAANTDKILSAGVTAGNAASVWVVATYTTLPSPNPGLVQGAPAGLSFSGTATDKVIGMWVSNANRAWGRGIQSDNSIINLSNVTGTLTSAGTVYLYLNQYNGSNAITQYVSGAVSSSVAYNGTLRSWSDFGIGDQGGETWNGDIAEVIAYNTSVNSAQRIIIDNYLAAKYGLTGVSNITNDIYTMDDVANGNFDYEVAGIGRFDVVNTQTDSEGSGFVRILNPTDLATDGEYFIWGHNNLAAQALNTVDIPSGLTGRFNRVWRVSETGEVGNVDLQFDVTGLPDFTGLSNCDAATSIRLLVDTNNDGLFADQTAISGATNIGGNVYRFANIGAINNGNRFTLGIVTSSVTGPGGVGGTNGTTNLKLWLDANKGVTITAGAVSGWADQSGNGLTSSSPAAGNRPTQVGNGLNGQPVINFASASSQYLELSSNINTTTPTTFIVANKATAGTAYMTVLTLQQNLWIVQAQGAGVDQWGMFLGGDVTTGLTLNSTYQIMTTVLRNFNDVDFYSNESAVINRTTGTSYSGKGLGTIGANNSSVTNTGFQLFNGRVAEIAHFNINLNTAERIIVDNYLAAKYGIALTLNDVYTRDNVVNGNFDFDVAGIGRVNAANLHADARGSGIVRVSNPTDLGDGEFFMWGHNGGTLIATTADVPAGVQARFNRVWAVSETGGNNDVGSIDIQFDLTGQSPVTASDLRLIIDDNGNGVFNEVTTVVIAGAVALSCNNYLFSGVPGTSITNGVRFTLGTSNKASTPLPIKLRSFEGIIKDGVTELSWITETETNNDFFTVERSEDGEKFISLIKIPGAGLSTEDRNYSATDEFPPVGKIYYRLRQTDYDGSFTYSKIILLTNLFTESKIQVSPNPVRIGNDINVKIISAEGVENSNMSFELYDLLGRSVSLESEQKDNTHFNIKTKSTLPAGMYILKVWSADLNKELYQRIYLSQ